MNVEFKVNSLQETLKKERKKIVFLVALAAVFFYVWIPLLKRSPRQGAVKPAAAAAKAAARARPSPASKAAKGTERAAAAVPKESAKKEPCEYPAFLGVPLPAGMIPENPFVSLGSRHKRGPSRKIVRKEPESSPLEGIRAVEKEKIAGMVLTSIMRFGRTPCCVIDGEVLGLGSTHKGLKIKEIGDQNVTLAGEGGEYRISVKD